MAGRIQLVVQADDLGMCRAVNEGIEHAIVDGIVTQTSVMAAAPWFVEGAEMARRTGVVTGLHATFTCEWDAMRWTPLSIGASLRLDDGTMPRTVEQAAEQIDPADGLAELRMQARRAVACGLHLAYVDPHMGISVASAYGAVCDDLGVRFIYPGVDPHHTFDSVYVLSMAWRRASRRGPGGSSSGSNGSTAASTSCSPTREPWATNSARCVLPTARTRVG